MDDTSITKVSVCMITYNHEPFIRQAIESILMQKCNFQFELIIGEDFSKDRTLTICKEYELQHKLITILPTDCNLGMIRNFVRTLKACKGKYIAICEGDDYWDDSLKLQKQVDILEANSDLGLVYSDIRIVDEYGKDSLGPEYMEIVRNNYFEGNVFWDLFQMNTVNTCTVLFRSSLVNFNNLGENSTMDHRIWLEIAKSSSFKFISDKLSVYRCHSAGMHNNITILSEAKKRMYLDVVYSAVTKTPFFINSFTKVKLVSKKLYAGYPDLLKSNREFKKYLIIFALRLDIFLILNFMVLYNKTKGKNKV